ncbi:MAG: Flp pilus assembly protein TadG [Myxococcota bacterium]|jgi:Flp pilus assembly protein TadG
MRSIRRRLRRGSAATEFAVWLPLVMTMISGLVDFSWFMSRYQNVVRIARDSARTGSATYEQPLLDAPGSKVVPAAEAHALEAFTMMNMDCYEPECTVNVTYREDPYNLLEVEIRYKYEPLIGLYKFDGNLYSKFVMLHEYQ